MRIAFSRIQLSKGILIGTLTVAGGLLGLILPWQRVAPTLRQIEIKARQYAYEPSVLRVNTGDTLRIHLASLDVVHGFFVEGHDIDAEIHPQRKAFLLRNPSSGEGWREVEELVFIAGRPGKYRYRCSHTCGTMHPFMLGELIVAPNLPFCAGIGSITGLFLGVLAAALVGSSRTQPAGPDEGKAGDAEV